MKIICGKGAGVTYRIYGKDMEKGRGSSVWIYGYGGYMEKICRKEEGVAHIGYIEDADGLASSNHVTPRSSPYPTAPQHNLTFGADIKHAKFALQIPKLRFDHDRKNPLNEFLT